ncbi:MAG: hypothetical protein ABIQ90_16630 [Polaromonas sp.]
MVKLSRTSLGFLPFEAAALVSIFTANDLKESPLLAAFFSGAFFAATFLALVVSLDSLRSGAGSFAGVERAAFLLAGTEVAADLGTAALALTVLGVAALRGA